jgi:hypothetical protein
MERRGSLWRDYGLSITLGLLFLLSWVAQFFTQWTAVANDAREHGVEPTWSEFWPQFLSSTFENWQSEFLQLLTFVVLTAFLIHRGSHESKDGDEELKAMIERVDRRLERLERGSRGDAARSA